MNRFIVYLRRFAMIIVGYFAASVTASIFMNVIVAGMAAGDVGDVADSRPLFDASLVLVVAAGAVFIGYFAFIPSMAAIVIGEIAGKRDWLFYAIGGAIAGLAVVTLFWVDDEPDTEPVLALLVVAAGICGAWVYWLITGRKAGLWRKAGKPTLNPPPKP